jgi:glutamate 5-kinase
MLKLPGHILYAAREVAGIEVQSCNPYHVVRSRGKLRWILSVAVKGTLWIDNGALAAVLDRRKSLFAAGITKVGHCAYQCC